MGKFDYSHYMKGGAKGKRRDTRERRGEAKLIKQRRVIGTCRDTRERRGEASAFNAQSSRGRANRASHGESRRHEHTEGVISISRGGAGFVTSDDLGIDVMIPKQYLDVALPGDRVRVALDPVAKGDDRRSGRVVSVLERATRDIVGTLQSSGHFFAVMPLSSAYKTSFYVRDAKGANIGDRVVVRFTGWPNRMFNPEGEIVDVIGPADKPSLDTEAIMRNYNLPEEFPQAVMREAELVSGKLGDASGRTDLRGKYIVTIDPVSARDFDDAISLEYDSEGRRVLGVHIADVSHFVRPGSALDAEALKRATSVYLVDKVIPMLPEQLSNGVCSLRPDEDRMTVSVFLTYSDTGRLEKSEFCRAVIRSSLRLAYEEAMAAIDGRTPESGKAIPAKALDLIRGVNELAQQLRAARFRRFALDLDVPEPRVVLDGEGRMTGITMADHDASHELIEECMVAANEAVAAALANRKIPYISRFHDAPAPDKLEELSASLESLGIRPGDLRDPRNIALVVQRLKDSPVRYYADMLILRSMKRAEYNADEKGHFGLGKKYYAHFTSPIRRYPDLETHRQLCLMIGADEGKQPSRFELRKIAQQSTEMERVADQASRDLVELKKYRFLAEQLESGNPIEYDAVIVKVMSYGLFVEIIDLQVTGMIHVSTLSSSFVQYDEARQMLRSPEGTHKTGGTIRVMISGVDFDERKIDFVPAAKRRPAKLPSGKTAGAKRAEASPSPAKRDAPKPTGAKHDAAKKRPAKRDAVKPSGERQAEAKASASKHAAKKPASAKSAAKRNAREKKRPAKNAEVKPSAAREAEAGPAAARHEAAKSARKKKSGRK